MKKYLVGLGIFILFTSGCLAPPKKELVEEIKTNETAFLVPLEGATKANQAKFMSLDYLENAKLATKRVTLPQRTKVTGRFWYEREWIPTMKVITVNRIPITREWTQDEKTGTTKKNDAIWVESKDSIGFAIGVNVTALIAEENAATFLYYYAGADLSSVIDKNIRGFVTSILSREFGNRDLTQCKTDKKEISDLTFNLTKNKFAEMGITVTNLGLVGGLTYEDKEIQNSINNAYVAEMSILQARHERGAQVFNNEKELSIAVTARQAAEEFAKAQEAMVAKVRLDIERIKAEAQLTASKKWNGEVPKSIVPQGANFLFGLDE